MNISHSTNESSEFAYPIGTQCFLGFLMIIMISVSVYGNGVVDYLIYRTPAMRSSINLLLATMAFSNFLLGLVCMPIDLTTLVLSRWVFGQIGCHINAFFFNLLTLVNVTILLCISIDRYIILIKRSEKLSSRTAKILIVVTWIYAGLINIPMLMKKPGFLPFTGQTHAELNFATTPLEICYVCLQFALTLFVPCCIMIFCYCGILTRVRQEAVKVGTQPDFSRSAETKRYSLANIARHRLLMVDMRFKTRTFATILIVFISLCVFCVPYSVCILVWNFIHHSPTIGYPYLLWWYYFNAAFNPLIYAWRIRKFRAACLEMFPVLSRCIKLVAKKQTLRQKPSTIYQLHVEPSYFTPTNSQPSVFRGNI